MENITSSQTHKRSMYTIHIHGVAKLFKRALATVVFHTAVRCGVYYSLPSNKCVHYCYYCYCVCSAMNSARAINLSIFHLLVVFRSISPISYRIWFCNQAYHRSNRLFPIDHIAYFPSIT